jgi:hypothetical protein
MSEKRILGFFCNFGIHVSATYLSQQWTGGYSVKNVFYTATTAGCPELAS